MLYLFGPKETDFINGDSDLIPNTYDEVVDRSKGFYLKFKVVLDKDKRYKNIKKEMIINAYTPDGWNQFRVFDIYNHSNHVEVVATHLHYDLNYKKVFPFNLAKATAQIALNVFVDSFKSELPNFTFTSNITDLHSFSTDDDLERLDEGHNALEILNRIAVRWGGELKVDGYNVHLIHKLGTFSNALLYEHKNISEFVDETSLSEVVTRIHAVSRFRLEREEGSAEEPEEVVIKVVVDSPLIDEYAQVYEEDYTNNDARTRDELISWANLKYSTNNIDKPARSIKVETNIIDGQEINYGDDLVLKYTKHDVDEIIRCVGYQYNPNSRQYISVTLGSNSSSLSSTITGAVHDSTRNQLSSIKKQVQIIQYAANNHNRVTTGPLPIPDPIEGDMWYYHPEGRPNEVELRIFQDGGWVTLLSDMTGENVRRAIADLELEAEDLAEEIDSNRLRAEEAVSKAEDSLEQIGTIDTKISDLRTDLNTVGGKAESSLEIIGIDGGVMYSKNRRLGSKSQPIQPEDHGLVQHNGEGFELGETYTISMKVSCIYDDIITWEDRSRTESVPFVRETQYRTDLYPDESFVQRNGINGTTTYTWQIELVNGEPTGNKTEDVISNHQAPVNEIFIQGTREEITWEDRSRTESIPFVREIQYRTDLLPEESFVQREGVNGTATYTWEVELHKGELTGNTTEEVRTNYQAPVNEIFIQGTKVISDVTFNFDITPFIPPSDPTSNVTFNFTGEAIQSDEWHATPSVNISSINRAPSSWTTMSLVDDFGAVGDGVTDDSQALKAALQHSNIEPIRLDVGGSEYEYYIPSNGNTRIENYPGVSKGIVIYGNGAVFAPKNERTIDKHEFYLMQIRAEKNAFIETSGFTLDGKHNPQDMFWWISQGKSTGAAALPLQKGIFYEGSDNIYIHDMTYRNMYGGYIIKLKHYTNVDIQNIRGYSVGGNDNPDSFGTIVHIDGQPDDSFINIDNMVIYGKKSPINPAWVSWIGIVIENGTTQSSDASVRLADRNTHINVTNSEFYDFESLYHIETQAGNIYWNTDNVKARVMNYTIGAGVRGEVKDRSNHMRLDILPFMRKGLSSGLYHTYRERPSNNLTDEHGAFNYFHMYNSVINYLPKEDYVGGVDVHAVSHADSVVANLHNVTLNNVPRWLVANASANLYDTQVNLKQGYNSSYSIFSNQEQFLNVHGTTTYNQAGSWKEAAEGSYPPLVTNTGFVAPPLTGMIGDILPPA